MARRIRKRKCAKCGKEAVWGYLPSGENHLLHFCDDCVPRGCSCNVDNIDMDGEPMVGIKLMWWDKNDELFKDGTTERGVESFYYENLDDNGRRYPCCEYDYDDEGYAYGDNVYGITIDNIVDALKLNKRWGGISQSMRLSVNDYINDINNTQRHVNDHYEYNSFMSGLYSACEPDILKSSTDKAFYESYKNSLSKYKIKIQDNTLIF